MATKYVYYLFADDLCFAHTPTEDSALAVFEIMVKTFPAGTHFELKIYEIQED